jgi:hypothetical protein
MTTEPMADSAELRLAKIYREEAEQIKKAAERDLEAIRYERGQIEHRHREMVQLEASISRREQRLKELGEETLLAREQAAESVWPLWSRTMKQASLYSPMDQGGGKWRGL